MESIFRTDNSVSTPTTLIRRHLNLPEEYELPYPQLYCSFIMLFGLLTEDLYVFHQFLTVDFTGRGEVKLIDLYIFDRNHIGRQVFQQELLERLYVDRGGCPVKRAKPGRLRIYENGEHGGVPNPWVMRHISFYFLWRNTIARILTCRSVLPA